MGAHQFLDRFVRHFGRAVGLHIERHWVSYADGEMEKPLFTEKLEPEDTGEPVDWGDDNEETEA